jgi:hypothetical protein
MQFLELSNVPKLFQKGSLFQELSNISDAANEENTTVSFPIKYCHFDMTNLLVVDDVCASLSTLRYWGVNEIPAELLVYLLEAPMTHRMVSLLTKEHREGDSFAFLVDLAGIRSMKIAVQKMKYAAEHGHLSMLAALHVMYQARNEVDVLTSVSICCAAASRGKLDCLRFLHEHGYAWCESTCDSAA